MKILIENSTWNNVGDGWYQFALYSLIKNIYPDHEIMLGEGPIRRAFRINNEKQKNNSLNLILYQKADLHIFSGPILRYLLSDYKEAIIKLKNRGEEYALISVSGTAIPQNILNEIGGFLIQYPPLFFSSRDEETYKSFFPYVKNIYNGICTAFLVDRTLQIQTFELDKKFFISSFYMELEPTYYIDPNKKFCIENIEVRHKKTLFYLPYKYSRHLDFFRKHQVEIGNHLIVRTIQNLNTRFNHINFATPNSFISFNPLSYLNVTKSSEFVISDRVHACVVALACGKPARFLFNTPRAGIFNRMGFDYKSNNGIMYPNEDKIDSEMYMLEREIKKYI